jgi:competence protein ComGC
MTLRSPQRGLGAIALILALLLIGVFYLAYAHLRSTVGERQRTVTAIDATRAFACRTNRQTVEHEIELWQVNHPGEPPSLAGLEADGIHIPSCPEGGTYSLEGVRVRCSRHE